MPVVPPSPSPRLPTSSSLLPLHYSPTLPAFSGFYTIPSPCRLNTSWVYVKYNGFNAMPTLFINRQMNMITFPLHIQMTRRGILKTKIQTPNNIQQAQKL
jgi:hypothetical protein